MKINIFVPLFDEDLAFDGNVDFHLARLVVELGFLEFLSYLREGQLNKEVL